MKSFFARVFTNISSLIVMLLLVLIPATIGIYFLVGLIMPPAVEPNSLLHLSLSYPMEDRTPKELTKHFNTDTFTMNYQVGVNDVVELIQHAESDPLINGIVLHSHVMADKNKVKLLREALVNFKSSGKKIISFSEFYYQTDYYLSSVADKIYLRKNGGVLFHGLSIERPYFRGMSEKWGVEFETHKGPDNQFKSFANMFLDHEMSEQDRLQSQVFIDGAWQTVLEAVAADRNIPLETLRDIAEGLKIGSDEDALSLGMIDELIFEEDFYEKENIFIGDANVEEPPKNKDTGKIAQQLVSLSSYYSQNKDKLLVHKNEKADDKIALLYASGSISGSGDSGITSDEYVQVIRELRKDENIKAVLFRVDSGGGSALASDQIHRELELLNKEKPYFVSMGSLAASGGYYISAGADRIFAEETTLTGSIGILTVVPRIHRFLKDFVGIDITQVGTSEHADVMSAGKNFDAMQSDLVQKLIDGGYYDFIQVVADGRGMTKEEVNEIARGRIWSGAKAKELGLVDELGDVFDTLNALASFAKLDSYQLETYPQPKSFVKQMMSTSRVSIKEQLLQEELGAMYPYYQDWQEILNAEGPQMQTFWRW